MDLSLDPQLTSDQYVVPAKIVSIDDTDLDHGLWIRCQVNGGYGQGFGGIPMNRDSAQEFILSLMEVFGLNTSKHLLVSPQRLVGLECDLLYAFPRSGEDIEGIRSKDTGRVFTLRAWREAKGFPNKDPLEERLAFRDLRIATLKRQIAEMEAETPKIRSQYRPLPAGEAPGVKKREQ